MTAVPHRRRRQCGAALLAALAFAFMASLAATQLVVMASATAKRQRETQLLFVGNEFKRAIRSYYNTVPPGAARTFPPDLDALVLDTRFAAPMRHLRRIYDDPIPGKADWQVIRGAAGGVVGVASRSAEKPLKLAGFDASVNDFAGTDAYSGWVFRIPE